MAENYTNNILILTSDGEYLTNDKNLLLAPGEIICYIDTTQCSDQEVEEMKSIIDSADWKTFCAACECETCRFTVSKLIDFINDMDDHYILLPDIFTLEELGEFIFDNYWDSINYEDIRGYIAFDRIGREFVLLGEAVQTSYGYMLTIW